MSFKLSHVSQVTCTRNFLESLDPLSQFEQLVKIEANDNYISQVNLNLPRLQQLHLANNFLVSIPDLTKIPMLKDLNLSQNKVTGLELVVSEQSYVQLERLDLSGNLIAPENTQIARFMLKLKKFTALVYLDLSGNTCLESEDKRREIKKALPKSI